VFLVRHGESEWNVQGRLQGQTQHVGLTPRGVAQAAAVGRFLAAQRIGAVWSSDQLRASLTAAAAGEAAGVPVRIDARLREQSYGRFEGRVVAATERLALAGGGESLADVHRRVGSVLAECLGAIGFGATERPGPRRIALVTHGETIRAAIAWLSGRESGEAPQEIPPNGSVTIARLRAGRATRLSVVVPRPEAIGVDGVRPDVVR
jgi:probable phosphoglycerate mutase